MLRLRGTEKQDNLDPVNYKIFEFCFGEMLSGACPPEAISECREQAVLLLDAYPILLERLKTQIFDNERIMARIYENARETEARVADGQPCGQNASRLQPIPEEHN